VNNGQLISFEGLDGAGKTTQMQLLEQWLTSRNVPYVRTREPGGTHLGIEIRHLLLNRPDLAITPLAEAFLFQADRAQHFINVVLPALAGGKLVITDRCIDASIAYQGHARGVGIELVTHLSMIATQGHIPDLTILLDLDPTQVHTRTDISNDTSGIRETQTRFDTEAEQFHQLVREAFLVLARLYPERIKVLDASLPPQQIHQQIIALVELLLDHS
jgi:dTMP kinase